MAYSPLQARGRDGKWIAKAGNATFRSISVGTGKKASTKTRVASHGKSTARNSGTIPYARVNKHSQTIGFNRGQVIPGGRRRVVVGAYARIEKTNRNNAVDRVVRRVGGGVFPTGTRRRKAASYLRKNVRFNNPALRATTPAGNQVRLGTSRGVGPTIIVRKGSHKTAQPKSALGVQKYNTRMSNIAGKRAAGVKKRPARRKAARRK